MSTPYMPNHTKYRPFPAIDLPDRKWPGRSITKAPLWVSSDLRDGNQALEVPMSLEQKLAFFDLLVEIGFKTIEISFPAASDTEFDFTRLLIDQKRIPQDVAIQVLTQSREHIIRRTIEALRGAPVAVVHLYNSTSTLQRKVVFNFSKKECLDLAVYGARKIKELIDADDSGTRWVLQYSPESFSGTEMDFAVEICDAVLDVWQPTPENKAIINLPNTVEMASPNVYADQVEYYCTHTRHRASTLVSIHPHNDRGTATAACELGILAGADRVEGTLFGNGERTGNADILNVAMNLFSQGIDPQLDLSNMDRICRVYEECTGMSISPRHPWAGRLVYTSFSGSHQDAIKKGMALQGSDAAQWEIPYLPIDPKDIGRSYDPIIRINSQSGKGGVAFILEQRYGLFLPKSIQQEFSRLCTRVSDQQHKELLPEEIFKLFDEHYINIATPLSLHSYREESLGESSVKVTAKVIYQGEEKQLEGIGNGLLEGFMSALNNLLNTDAEITLYHEHAMTSGSEALAASYVQVRRRGGNDQLFTGAGISSSVTKSALRAVVSAVNAML